MNLTKSGDRRHRWRGRMASEFRSGGIYAHPHGCAHCARRLRPYWGLSRRGGRARTTQDHRQASRQGCLRKPCIRACLQACRTCLAPQPLKGRVVLKSLWYRLSDTLIRSRFLSNRSCLGAARASASAYPLPAASCLTKCLPLLSGPRLTTKASKVMTAISNPASAHEYPQRSRRAYSIVFTGDARKTPN